MAGEVRQGSCLSSLSLLLTILLLVPSCNSGAVQLDTNNIDGLSCHLPHLWWHPYHLICSYVHMYICTSSHSTQIIETLLQGFLRTTTWCWSTSTPTGAGSPTCSLPSGTKVRTRWLLSFLGWRWFWGKWIVTRRAPLVKGFTSPSTRPSSTSSTGWWQRKNIGDSVLQKLSLTLSDKWSRIQLRSSLAWTKCKIWMKRGAI